MPNGIAWTFIGKIAMTKLPNLFIVGERKCGTTYLCRTLAKHPEIFFPEKLETNFFNRQEYEKVEKLVAEHYSNADPSVRYWGEGSTPSFQAPYAMENIISECGKDIQVFFALRHPIDRIVSHFYHDVKRNSRRNVKTLTDGRYVDRSTYASHARRWLDRLGEQAHALKYESLVADANAYLANVTDSLGLERLADIPKSRTNIGYSIIRDGDLLKRKEGDGPFLRLSDLQDILKNLKSDIDETAAITGLDLQDWHEMPEWPSLVDAAKL